MPVTGFNIDSFKSSYQDLARQYTFMIMVSFPGVAGASLGTNDIKYLVQSSTMPTSEIEPIEVWGQGMLFPLGSTQRFADWTVTFRLDSAAQLRRDFLGWQRAVHDPETNIHGSPTDYMEDQEVGNLNPQGERITKMKLTNAGPVTVGELTLDYGSTDVQQFDVTGRYLYHVEV